MNTTIDRQQILQEIDTLDCVDKLHILSYITKDLIKSGAKTNHQLTELRGLGKEIWQNCDIDNYIQTERASWD
jgi:hypothetical protein